MNPAGPPLIVGAGPVGLGVALFLARQGQAPRILEMRDEPSSQSRALAVNPSTLDILKPKGSYPVLLNDRGVDKIQVMNE